MYGGMAVQSFFLTLFLQQLAGFSALEAGSAGLLPTVVMFLLSRRFGALADRYGPRWFMTVGPLLVAAGFLALLRLDETTSYVGDLVPALLLYSLGLAVTVSPLTATVLADADEHDAGIARRSTTRSPAPSALLATAAVGAVLAGFYADRLDSELAGRTLSPAAQAQVERRATARSSPVDPRRCRRPIARSSPPAVQDAGVDTFHLAAVIGAACWRSPACSAACCCATRAGRPRRSAAPAASSSELPRRPVAAPRRRSPRPPEDRASAAISGLWHGPPTTHPLIPLELPIADAEPRERADAQRNRKKVLSAAERLFACHGVENVSMDAIAAEAGVGKGTLFRRFGDRAGLALAVLDEHTSRCRRGSSAALRRSAPARRRRSGSRRWPGPSSRCSTRTATCWPPARPAGPARASAPGPTASCACTPAC